MSYEGHTQWLCKNGHLHHFDCYDTPSSDWVCDNQTGVDDDGVRIICGTSCVWRNSVDDTNGDLYGAVNMDQFLVNDSVVENCPTCNHGALVADTVYRIPTPEEAEKARTYQGPYPTTPQRYIWNDEFVDKCVCCGAGTDGLKEIIAFGVTGTVCKDAVACQQRAVHRASLAPKIDNSCENHESI